MVIHEELAAALRESGGKFVLPFSFKDQGGVRISHSLIFVSKHEKAFEIMKEIMAKESSTSDEGVASLEYSPADANTPLLFSLKRSMEQLRGSLLSTFRGQTLPMIEIYNQHHVDTPFIKRNYKDALLELEQTKIIYAEPTKRPGGTFGDNVRVTFPKTGKS
jgi:hypothetical protein